MSFCMFVGTSSLVSVSMAVRPLLPRVALEPAWHALAHGSHPRPSSAALLPWCPLNIIVAMKLLSPPL